MRRAAQVAGAAVGVQAALTAGQAARALLVVGGGAPQDPPPAKTAGGFLQAATKAHPAAIERAVMAMYGGGWADVDAQPCAADATFEDPVARWSGLAELQEALRSLRALRPKLLAVHPASDTEAGWDLAFDMHLRYLGRLELRSTLLVEVGHDGRIRRLEERWNGTPLLQAAPFRWSRRLNGKILAAVAPWVA